MPRAQGPDENCTIQNDNMVPLRDGRYVAVSGNYQAGTWVSDAATGGAIKLDHLNPQTKEFSLWSAGETPWGVGAGPPPTAILAPR